MQIEQWDLIVDDDCDIVLASTATMWRKDWQRIKKFNPKDFKLIISDESHRLCVESNIRILTYFWAYKWIEWGLKPWHPVVLWVTASPMRQDWVWLSKVLDKISFTYTMKEAIDDWNLVPPRAFSVFTDTDLNWIHMSWEDFNIWELSDAVNNPERNLQVVETYISKCNNEMAVVFCADVNHAKSLCKVFIDNWISADYITWALDKNKRKQILEDFHNEKLKVILNISTLVEWWDEPNIRSVLLTSPTCSNIKFIQMIWRGSRLAPWKDHFKIFDFIDNMRKNKIVTASSLIGISQPIKADNTDLFAMKDKLEELLNSRPNTNLRDLNLDEIDKKIQEVDIFKLSELDDFVKANSKYAWNIFLWWFKISLWEDQNTWDKLSVEIRENTLWKYNISFIKAIKQEASFSNWFKGFRNKVTATFDVSSKKEALSLADKVISDNYSDRLWLVETKSKWRWDEITESQINILKKNGYPNASNLNKGQACILIAKIFWDKFKK